MNEALEKARRLEALLAEVHALAVETNCVAPAYMLFLKVMERNVMKHYHNQKDGIQPSTGDTQ